ncbi:MAG: acyl carrier protein [Candidatus Brocadiae bacterium]|nr:acyl carrier protein [Candidatus Brocadiia bacterium]
MPSDLNAELKALIIARLKLEITPADIADAAPLFGEGLGLDSIDALELVVGIERQYGIRIADAEMGRKAFGSVDALAAFIQEKKAAL